MALIPLIWYPTNPPLAHGLLQYKHRGTSVPVNIGTLEHRCRGTQVRETYVPGNIVLTPADVSWLHEKMRRVISFQVIRNNLGFFRNRIAYFATDLKKVLNSSAMPFEFEISILFTIKVVGSFTECLFLFITCRSTAHVSL